MKHFLNALDPRRQLQTQSARADQVSNHAGGFVFAVSDETRLLRFLILGTEGGTFYASEAKQTKIETEFISAYAVSDGARMLEIILSVARDNRAPKVDPTLLALAAVAKLGDLATRKAAWDVLPEVARTGTHLLHFLEFVQLFGGWGRLTRGGVAKLFETMPLERLALWAVKYKSRDGWAQRDALRLAHPKSSDASRNALFKYLTAGVLEGEGATDPALAVVRGSRLAQGATSDAAAAALMREYRLPIEAIPTHLRGTGVYEQALETNGLTWTLRNLGNLGRMGLLVPGHWNVIERIVGRITDVEQLRRARVHPMDALKALMVYGSGRAVRGSGEWVVVPQVRDALEAAFYESFAFVKPTGKRYLLAMDVSGSMNAGMIAGVPGLTPRIASAAMAMVTLRSESRVLPFAFSAGHSGSYGGRWGAGDPGFTPLDLSNSDSLEAAIRKIEAVPMGGTDCALPMRWALENRVPVDVFVVYTDNETWVGKVHPYQALREYRQKMGIAARLVVVGMTSSGFSIADPKDAGMLDVVGFDSNAPSIISSFAAGEL